MADLLLVDVPAEVRRSLQGLASSVHEVCGDDLDRVITPDVHAVLVGGSDPTRVLSLVQRVHVASHDAKIAAVVSGAVMTELHRLVRFAPDVPVDLELFEAGAGDLLAKVDELCRTAVTQRRHARVLASLEARDSKRASAVVVGATLGTLLEHAPLGVLVVDRQERLLVWNAKAAQLLDLESTAAGQRVSASFADPGPVTVVVTAAFESSPSEPGPVLTSPGRDGSFLDLSATRSQLDDGRDVVLVLVQDATARRRAELERDRLSSHVAMIGRVSEALIGTQDPDEALHRLAEQVVPTLGDWVEMQVYDGRGMTRSVVARHSDPEMAELTEHVRTVLPRSMSELSPSRRIARGEGPFLLPRVTPEMLEQFILDAEVRELLVRLGVNSALAVPLSGRRGVFGSMVVLNRAGSPALGPSELAVAVEVGRRAGTALDSLEVSQRQRKLAQTLQLSMLTAPPTPEHAEIAVRYLAAADEAQVGGDWYDSYLQADGSIVVTIGDVVGHDTRAAASMGQLRGLLRGIGYSTGEGPAQMLRLLDAAIEGLLAGTTATAVVARLTPHVPDDSEAALTLTWSNAGHPPPMLVPLNGRPLVLASEPTDLILGVVPDMPRVQQQVSMAPGDTLLLYTDGLIERRDRDLDQGLAELRDALEELGELHVEDLCDQLLRRMVDEGRDDDVALIALRLKRA